MGVYRITGTNRSGKYGSLCIVRAGSGEEALRKAREIFGPQNATGTQGFNDMCDGCALLGHACEGSHLQLWTGCVRREKAESRPEVIFTYES